MISALAADSCSMRLSSWFSIPFSFVELTALVREKSTNLNSGSEAGYLNYCDIQDPQPCRS